MTICIASICQKGKNVVVSADRMFTMSAPLNLEFEPPISKIEKLATNCAVMAAGNSVYAQEIINRTGTKLATGKAVPTSAIATQLKVEYGIFRDSTIDESIIRAALGQDFTAFRDKGGTLPAYLQVQPGVYQQLIVQATQFDLGLQFLVAGVEAEVAHIYYIGHPGTLLNFDKLGHAAIGSGALHAAMELSLVKQTPTASLSETLFAVYSAKRAAEVAPGVGKETEMMVISSQDAWTCTQPMLEELAKKHEEYSNKQKPKLEEIEKVYAEQRKTG